MNDRETLNELAMEDLRERAREVEHLLRVARQAVEEGFQAEDGGAAAIARMTELFEEVGALLPGDATPLTREEREALERSTEESRQAFLDALDEPLPPVPEGTPPPTPEEIEHAHALIAQLQEQIERAEILEDIADGLRELAALLEDSMEASRSEAALKLTIAAHLPKPS